MQGFRKEFVAKMGEEQQVRLMVERSYVEMKRGGKAQGVFIEIDMTDSDGDTIEAYGHVPFDIATHFALAILNTVEQVQSEDAADAT